MAVNQARHFKWVEAIGLFQQVASGDYLTARRLLATAADPAGTVDDLMRMLIVFFRDEEDEKIQRFVEAAYRMGPPPPPPPGQVELAKAIGTVYQRIKHHLEPLKEHHEHTP